MLPTSAMLSGSWGAGGCQGGGGGYVHALLSHLDVRGGGGRYVSPTREMVVVSTCTPLVFGCERRWRWVCVTHKGDGGGEYMHSSCIWMREEVEVGMHHPMRGMVVGCVCLWGRDGGGGSGDVRWGGGGYMSPCKGVVGCVCLWGRRWWWFQWTDCGDVVVTASLPFHICVRWWWWDLLSCLLAREEMVVRDCEWTCRLTWKHEMMLW